MLKKYQLKKMIALLTLMGCLATTNTIAQTANNGWQSSSGAFANEVRFSVLQRSGMPGAANNPYPHFLVVNEGSGPISLGNLKLRYWFNCDCQPETTVLAGWTDWAGMLPSGTNITSKVRGYFEHTTAGNQTHAAVIGFTSDAPVLQPGQSVQINIRLNKADWSNLPQGNDWSYAPFSNFSTWNKVTGYIEGVIVWGLEPY